MTKAIVILLFIVGISLIISNFKEMNDKLNEKINEEPKVVYRYIPRTFEEEQMDPVLVTDIFQTMFSQPSPWIGSIRNYDRRRQEKINKYFVNQL
jgi:hypothetical protein